MRNGETNPVADVVNGQIVRHRTTYVVELQTALLRLVRLASSAGHAHHDDVRDAKELIRCRVTGCGLGGA